MDLVSSGHFSRRMSYILNLSISLWCHVPCSLVCGVSCELEFRSRDSLRFRLNILRWVFFLSVVCLMWHHGILTVSDHRAHPRWCPAGCSGQVAVTDFHCEGNIFLFAVSKWSVGCYVGVVCDCPISKHLEGLRFPKPNGFKPPLIISAWVHGF